MKFRVRPHRGPGFEIQLATTATVSDLRVAIGAGSSGARVGYPPIRLCRLDGSKRLVDSGIIGGELISMDPGSKLRVKRIPKDNSCLFNAVGYLMEGQSLSQAEELRHLVADLIRLDPQYTDAILGRPRHEYMEWIVQPSSWGGAIELSILSRYYQVEMVSIDSPTLRLDRYGSHDQKALLLYDGSHYDAIVLECSSEQETVFAGEEIVSQAVEMVRDLVQYQ